VYFDLTANAALRADDIVSRLAVPDTSEVDGRGRVNSINFFRVLDDDAALSRLLVQDGNSDDMLFICNFLMVGVSYLL